MDIENFDWQPGKKNPADFSKIKSEYKRVDELAVSPDGERLAALVQNEDDSFGICVNGELIGETTELAWYLRFLPNGKFITLVRIDDAWTVAVDGMPWEERFEYVWNPQIALDGDFIGVLYKRDMMYGVAIDGKPWENSYTSIRDFCISPDGKNSAATVQVAVSYTHLTLPTN